MADAAAPETRYATFTEFFPFYLGEHSNRANRWLHFVGTSIGVGVVVWFLATGRPWLAPLGLLPGYAFAWFGHFFVEKNKPASFKYPLWSFIGDFKMYGLMLTGKV